MISSKFKIQNLGSKLKTFNFSLLTFNSQKGQSLVEILLAMGLSAILLPALLTGLVSSRQGKVQQAQRTQAVYLLNETVDAVRSVREKGWAGFAVNGTFSPVVSGSSWMLATGSATTNGFTRQVDIIDVNRDSNGKIVDSGGTGDPSTKKVNVIISWTTPYISSISDTLYMTRYLENNAYIETKGLETPLLDFDLGTVTDTVITKSLDGEVTLGAGGGGGDWCNPSKSITQQDLPKSGVANAVTAIESGDGNVVVFAGTGDNSSGVSFAKVNVVGDDPSISTSIPATFDGYKTNVVFGEENFAYLGTDNNSKEIVIMSLTQYSDSPINSKYEEVGSINLPGNIDANSIYVTNDKIYIVSSDRNFYIYNLSFDRTSATLQNTGGLLLANEGEKVMIVGDKAYVVVDATSNQLQIINISNPSSPSIVAQISVAGQDGKDVFINDTGTRAYLATENSASQREFFIVDIDPSSETYRQVRGSYDSNGMDPKGVTVVTGNRAILVGSGGTLQYQVINTEVETNPVSCGPGLSYSTGINGVASHLKSSGFAYSYIITGDANNELKIILGGAGGQYSSSGNFVSQTFDPGYKTAFNRFDVTINRPANTDVQLQVAAKQDVSGSCAGVSFAPTDFVGPSGTNEDKFLTSVTSGLQVFNYAFPLNINPARCLRYKAFLMSSDPASSPTLYDIIVNYSP